MSINNKLIQFVDYLNISQRRFTTECGISEGILRNSNSIGIESLQKVKSKYPKLNIDWLLFDKGNMVLYDGYIVEEPEAIYQKHDDCEKRYVEVLKKLNETQEKLISANERIIELSSIQPIK